MFRTNLMFLDAMFTHEHFTAFNILIVNQTTEDKLLKSEYSNVRVVNSFERGSPASRNLAIRLAIGDIVLMSDDDIVYEKGLEDIILSAYRDNESADMISFEANNEDQQRYTTYFPEGVHNKISLTRIYTWVISFRRKAFEENQVFFNHHFGVGSTFKGSTEYVFLRYAFDKGLHMIHKNKLIVMHPNISSGVLMGSDDAFFSKTALRQRFLGDLSYIWLVKYVIYAWILGYIPFKDIPYKFGIGLKGIKTYKKLKVNGEIDRIHVSQNYRYSEN